MSSDYIFTKYHKANVYLRNKLAGRLEKVNNKAFKFEYDTEWIKVDRIPIGLALPIDQSPFIEEELHPFFDNLIPEGWLLSSVQQIYKIDKKNRFALLLATGLETIGAIKIVAIDESGNEIKPTAKITNEKKQFAFTDIEFESINNRCPYCLMPLTDSQIKKNQSFHEKCSREMWGTTRKLKLGLNSKDPLLSFLDSIRGASISGAQRKGLFKLDKSELLPSTFGSRYILKPKGDYDHLPENEHLTMSIAKAIGFEVPPFTIFRQEKLGYIFAIKRFDINDEGVHLRLEDAGQILGYSSSDKYDSSYEELASAINKYSDARVPDLVEMWKRLIFCFLTANGDMHLKNWSLLEQKSLRGVFRLSPCYDLLNTRIALKDKEESDLGLFLSEGNRNPSKDIFMAFAKKIQIERFAEETLADLNSWYKIAEELCNNSFLPSKLKDEYLEVLNSRYKILTK